MDTYDQPQLMKELFDAVQSPSMSSSVDEDDGKQVPVSLMVSENEDLPGDLQGRDEDKTSLVNVPHVSGDGSLPDKTDHEGPDDIVSDGLSTCEDQDKPIMASDNQAVQDVALEPARGSDGGSPMVTTPCQDLENTISDSHNQELTDQQVTERASSGSGINQQNDNVEMNTGSPIEPTQFEVESIIIDEDNDRTSPKVAEDQLQQHPLSAISKAIFMTQDGVSKESIFSTNLDSAAWSSLAEHRLKRQRTQLITAQNSHPNCFQPITAARIHGGLLAKNKMRPRKSYKPMIVQNEINFPPIRATHTAPETAAESNGQQFQRNSSQIVTRRVTIFTKNVSKSSSRLDKLKSRERRTRPFTQPEMVHRCSRYGRPYFRKPVESLTTHQGRGEVDGESNQVSLTPANTDSIAGDPTVSNPSNSHVKWAMSNSLDNIDRILNIEELSAPNVPATRTRTRLTIASKKKPLGLPKINRVQSPGLMTTTNLSLGDLHIARANIIGNVPKDSNTHRKDLVTSLPLI